MCLPYHHYHEKMWSACHFRLVKPLRQGSPTYEATGQGFRHELYPFYTLFSFPRLVQELQMNKTRKQESWMTKYASELPSPPTSRSSPTSSSPPCLPTETGGTTAARTGRSTRKTTANIFVSSCRRGCRPSTRTGSSSWPKP